MGLELSIIFLVLAGMLYFYTFFTIVLMISIGVFVFNPLVGFVVFLAGMYLLAADRFEKANNDYDLDRL